jgi:hypothetical protein
LGSFVTGQREGKWDGLKVFVQGGEVGWERWEFGCGEPEGGMRLKDKVGRRGGKGEGFVVEEGKEEGGIGGMREGGGGEGQEARGQEGGREGAILEREGVGGVGAQELTEGGEEELVGALVGACEDEAGRFGGVSEESGADGTLKIELEGRVGAGEAVEERVPDGRGGGGIEVVGEKVGEIVVRGVGEEFAGTQVKGAVAQVEQIRVGVQGGMGEDEIGEGANETQQGVKMGQGFAAGEVFEDAFAEFGILIGEPPGLVEKVFERFAGKRKHGIGVG